MSKGSAYVSESETWIQIDEDTGEYIGEPKKVDVVLKQSDRAGFMITYLSTIIQVIERLGNKKMQVVKFLLQKMDKSSNTLIKTIPEIVAETGISTQTVSETLKILEEANIISRRPGVVMLSPKLVHRGNAQKERLLLTRFCEIKPAKTADEGH